MNQPSNRRMTPLAVRLEEAAWATADWLFPPHCIGCGEAGEIICPVCQRSVVRIPSPCCPLCASPVEADGTCYSCRTYPPSYNELYCMAAYTGLLRQSIHRLKYRRDIGMGRFLASLLVPSLILNRPAVDMIIPMPLSERRHAARGYNQAAIITRRISQLAGWPHAPHALLKVRDTESQVHLHIRERLANLEGAFEATPEIVRGKRVVLLDDVFTTGATMRQACKALKHAGAGWILAVTVARTLRGSHLAVDSTLNIV